MKARQLLPALALLKVQPLPAQQNPAAVLALSHALDSKLAFSTSTLEAWEVLADAEALSGTALKIPANSRASLESILEGPASLRFMAKGGFHYGIRPVFPASGLRFSTPESDDRPSVWREYRFTLPAGRHRLFWEGYGWERSSFLDAVIVNLPQDDAAIRAALDYQGEVTFPSAGQWTVDLAESVLGGASLRQPAYSNQNPMEMPVTGPAVLRYALQTGGDGSISGLSVRMDGREVYQGWGQRHYRWLPMGLFIPEGTHKINFLNPSNNGVVWMDALAVEPVGTGLAEALDFPGPWTVSGPYPWHAQPALTHAGTTAAAVSYPSAASGMASKLATRVQGPGVLSFQTSHEGSFNGSIGQTFPRGIHLEMDGFPYAETMPVSSTYPVTNAAWQPSRIHVPPGEHVVTWSAAREPDQAAALYLLDSLKMEPVPEAAMRAALDSSLAWQSTGVHVPVIKTVATVAGGSLLESPANRTGTCQMSLPVSGPARLRFRFSHGIVPSGSAIPQPGNHLSVFRNGLRVAPGPDITWPTPGGGSTTYEVGLPSGELELVLDLKDPGTTQAIPVQFDAVAILTGAGESFAQWAQGLSLSPAARHLDPDNDQRSNFFEYAFGTSPYQKDIPAEVLTITPATEDRAARLIFKWLPDRMDAVWAIQESTDLISWQDRWVPQTADAVAAGEGFRVWKTEIPSVGTNRWFRAVVRAVGP